MRLGGFRFCRPPELITLVVDRRLDGGAREPVRRGLLRPDHARSVPGRVFFRQSPSGRLPGEAAQVRIRSRREHVKAHHSLPPPKLSTGRRTSCRSAALVLMPEHEPAPFQIVGRHLDRDTVSRQRLDPVPLHLSGRIDDHLMARIKLHAKARIGQDLGHQPVELHQFFLAHNDPFTREFGNETAAVPIRNGGRTSRRDLRCARHRAYAVWMLLTAILPERRSSAVSKETFWPSTSPRIPARSRAVAWTNTSLEPSSGWIKPKPFWSL